MENHPHSRTPLSPLFYPRFVLVPPRVYALPLPFQPIRRHSRPPPPPAPPPPPDRHPPRVYAPLQTSRRRPPGVVAVPVDASRAPVHTDRPPATHNTPLIPIKRRPIRKWTNVWTYAQAPLASLVDRPNTARHTPPPPPISPSCSTILTRHSQLVYRGSSFSPSLFFSQHVRAHLAFVFPFSFMIPARLCRLRCSV